MPRTFENLAHCCVRLAHNCPDQKTSHELDAISAELMEEAADELSPETSAKNG
jgi:hypothetical protein